MSTEPWYNIRNIDQLDSPALVVFPQRVKANIQTAIRMTGDVQRLRPHVKTNKSPDVTRLMLEAGITKFKCATIAEAEMLAICGAKDVLLAYQPIGPKLERFIQLIKKYTDTKFSCLTDNIEAATQQSVRFTANDLSIPVFLDLNVGMNRSGIAPGQQAMDLYTFISSADGIEAAGLHVYDGHIRDNDIVKRTAACNEAYRQAEEFHSDLLKKSLLVPVVIAGGSPSFPIHAQRKNVECSPGTFIYWDKGYVDGCPEQEFLTAAVLVTRIISLPAAHLICTDLGHKSVAAENEIHRRVHFLNADGLKPIGQSEEHLVLEVNKDHSFHTGNVLYGLPFHVCPTVALYDRVYTIEDNMVTGEWKTTARDRKISI